MSQSWLQSARSWGSNRERAVAPVIAIVLLVAMVVVLSAVLAVTSLQIAPEDGYTSQPQGAFEYEYDDGVVRVYPTQISNDAKFDLVVKGTTVYTWEGDGATDVRELRCLYPGDTVRIVNDAGDKTYVNSEWEVKSPTKCPIEGTEKRFTTVMVNDKKEPVFRSQYEFTLKIGPDEDAATYEDVDNEVPVTNEWHYVQRYNRTVEGLQPPVYVIVLADNADYDDSPEDGEVVKSYEIEDDGTLNPTPTSENEPTNDIYMVFRPGCDESKLKFIAESAGYSNTIILGEEVIIQDTNDATEGKTYTAGGVECVEG